MKSVLITGSSSGIGRACALHLADSGFRVLAGVRDRGDGAALAKEAVSMDGELEPLAIDVTDEGSIDSALERVKELTDGDGLVALVNNAGQPVAGPLEVLPIADLRHEFDVNLIGQVAVTQAFLPMLRASRGRVIFVSSIGGRIVLPFAGAYHASKFALEAVAEVLRMELHGSGVDVVAVEPGVTDSLIWGKAEKQAEQLLADLPAPQRNLYAPGMAKFRERVREVRDGENMDPEEVAKAVEKAISSSRPSTRMPVGKTAWAAARVRPLVPDRIWSLLARRPFST